MTRHECPPLSFRQALLAMLGVSLVLMLSALDQTVIGNALPSIVAELNGFELYAWVATGYLLASIVTIPVFGRLGDYYGRKPFVIAATLIFTFASLLCALADGMVALVAGRALQGIGGGMLVGTAFACIPELFPDTRQRLRWQIMLSSCFSIVNAIGPGLGGVLTAHFGWRSVFWLNLPLGALALYFAWRHLPWYRPAKGNVVRMDWTGAVLIALALGSLQLFVEWLGHASTLACATLGLLSLAAFAALWFQERRCPAPLLPDVLFKDPSLRVLFILALLAGAVMFTLLFYLPLLLQSGYGYSPQQAGVLITPLALSITLGAIVNSRVMTRMANPNRLPQGGFLALALACAGLALAGPQAGFNSLLWLILLAGLGLGFIFLNLSVFTQTLAQRQYLGIATALQQSLRLVGGLLGTACMGALVNVLYAWNLRQALATAGHPEALSLLADPQVLAHGTAAISPALLALGRGALIEAIAAGLLLCALLAATALWVLRGLPVVQLLPVAGAPASQGHKP